MYLPAVHHSRETPGRRRARLAQLALVRRIATAGQALRLRRSVSRSDSWRKPRSEPWPSFTGGGSGGASREGGGGRPDSASGGGVGGGIVGGVGEAGTGRTRLRASMVASGIVGALRAGNTWAEQQIAGLLCHRSRIWFRGQW